MCNFSAEGFELLLFVLVLFLLGSAVVEIAILKWFTGLERPVLSYLRCLFARFIGFFLVVILHQSSLTIQNLFPIRLDWLVLPTMLVFFSFIISIFIFSKEVRGRYLFFTSVMTTSVLPVLLAVTFWGFKIFGSKT
jgi:hypothetical protein